MNALILLKLVKESKGEGLAAINPWKYPAKEPWKTKFFYDMWSSALEHDSTDGFHTLALYTPPECLVGALELAISHHSIDALVPLINAFKDIPQISSCHPCCEKCPLVFSQTLKWFPELSSASIVKHPSVINISS